MEIEIRSVDHDSGDYEVLGRIDGGEITEGREALASAGVVGYLELLDDPEELLGVLDGPRTLAVAVESPPDPDGDTAEKAAGLLERLADTLGL